MCGSLQHIGGGVHRRVVGDVEQRWIATLLTPATVAELLDDCGPNGIPHDAMHACVKPDSELAVTCVAITANDPKFDRLLDEVAAQAMSAFLVEELMRSTHQNSTLTRSFTLQPPRGRHRNDEPVCRSFIVHRRIARRHSGGMWLRRVIELRLRDGRLRRGRRCFDRDRDASVGDDRHRRRVASPTDARVPRHHRAQVR